MSDQEKDQPSVPDIAEDLENVDLVMGPDGVEYLIENFCNIYRRQLTPAELEALRANYPYIEICNPDVFPDSYDKVPEHHITEAGWHIVDRTHHLVMGPGRGRWGKYDENKDDGDGGDGLPEVQPMGTLMQQAFVSIEELMMVAFDRWAAVQIVGGDARLGRMSWHYAERTKNKIYGYDATHIDKFRHSNIELLGEVDVKEIIELPELTLQNK